ncbi:MAG TPA: response regulator transcription factor [Chloroflexia bacterium]|jgi:DNA-binding response OmpR family regulator
MTRVLVVDDEVDIRQVLAYVLVDEGYEVDEASNGEAALELIERRHPDVIILDMKMPGIDGWEFARRYRDLYGNRAPIIVLTAAQDAARRGTDISAESYVPKPFDLDVLVERVSALVRSPGTGKPTGT